MTFPRETHRRHSTRLKEYDYSLAGAYFVTVCTYERKCILAGVYDGTIKLSNEGLIVKSSWENLSDHYPHVRLDAYVIMPNHVHGIIVVDRDDIPRAGLRPAPTDKEHHGLPEIVRAFNAFSSRRINEFRGLNSVPVWQRSYYEHIIRNDRALDAIRAYIEANPHPWADDPDNPRVACQQSIDTRNS